MAETVPAAVIKGPGVVDIEEFPMPEVGPDYGLLKVEATGIVGADYEYYSGMASKQNNVKQPVLFPFIPGHIITGRIARLGPVARERWGLEEGDRVLLQFNVTCGQCYRCQVGEQRICENLHGYGLFFDFTKPPYLWGGAARYMMLHPNTKMVKVPEHADLSRVLLSERLADAFHWLQDLGGLTVYDSVVILGTGALAEAAVAFARFAGARPVIVVARSESQRGARMREVGADHVVTGTVDEKVAAIMDLTEGRGASLIVDLTSRDADEVTGLAMRSIAYQGRLVQVSIKMPNEMSGITGGIMIGKEPVIIGVKGHDVKHLQWAARCLDRPEFDTFLSSKVAKYDLMDIKSALDQPPTLNGSSLTVVYPHGQP